MDASAGAHQSVQTHTTGWLPRGLMSSSRIFIPIVSGHQRRRASPGADAVVVSSNYATVARAFAPTIARVQRQLTLWALRFCLLRYLFRPISGGARRRLVALDVSINSCNLIVGAALGLNPFVLEAQVCVCVPPVRREWAAPGADCPRIVCWKSRLNR